MTHFLQSPAWKTFQEALGRQVITDSGNGWSYQAIIESGTGNVRLYSPYGPTFTSVKEFDEAMVSLKKAAIKHNAAFLRIEPTAGITASELQNRGFKPVTYQQLQPAHTLVIDLTPAKADILAQMSQNSRNITRNYAKKGISIHTSTDPGDITILTSLLAGVGKRNNINTHTPAYFKTQAEALFPAGSALLYYALAGNTPVAAALVYDDDRTRYYAHAAADDSYRKLSAGTALVGQMILDAKDNGLRQFDLYGIAADDSPHHPWAGFTKFKRSFGGAPVTFLGAWDLPLQPLRYRLYRFYQSLRSFLK